MLGQHLHASCVLLFQALVLVTLSGRLVCGSSGVPELSKWTLRVFVEEVPSRFVDPRTTKLQSNASLGTPRIHVNGEMMWASAYMWMDYWVSHLARTSPLRTHDRDTADIVYVPHHVPDLINDGLDSAALCEAALSFFREAPSFLPMLGKVPHVMTVSQPPTVYASVCAGFLQANLTGNFTFISIEDSFYGPGGSIVRLPNYVAAAYFGSVHYAPNSPEVLSDPSGASFDESTVVHLKRSLCLASWRTRGTMPLVQKADAALAQHTPSWWHTLLTRLAQRLGLCSAVTQNHERWVLRAQCLARRSKCEHIEAAEISSEKPMTEYFAAVFKTKFVTHTKSHTSWFVLMPHGDFVTRGAFYDALLAGSIPVMLLDEFRQFYPYADILNYDAFTVSIPYAEVFGSNSSTGDGGGRSENGGGDIESVAVAHNFNLVDALDDRFNVSVRLAKLRAVYAVRRLMQWSLEPVHDLVRFDTRNVIQDRDDAFTFTFKAVLRNLCDRGELPKARCGVNLLKPRPALTAALVQHR